MASGNPVLPFETLLETMLPPAHTNLEQRRPVWRALSDLYLDTDVSIWRDLDARVLTSSPYTLDELDTILREEVHPACAYNLTMVAGEWAGFDDVWLERRILRGGPPPRPWWRRLQRHLTLGTTVPVQPPVEDWEALRAEVARLRLES